MQALSELFLSLLLEYQMWGSKLLLLREKLGVVSALLIVDCCSMDEVCGETVISASPNHFNVVFFLLAQCVRVTQLLLGFFQRKLFCK